MFNRTRRAIGKLLGIRPQIDVAQLTEFNRMLRARYDAAQNSTEYQNIWANADRYDADSAHSREVRHTLISRSRYEIGNNGFSDGIAQTYATDLVGLGPTLRMQSGSEGFNRMVETEWFRWCRAVRFRQKLWCMAHAKHSDGEGIGVMRRNARVKHPIKLDVVLYEAEQCQSQDIWLTEGRIDGIDFDEFGNPTTYHILHQHPGTSNGLLFGGPAEAVPAEMVLHWFKMRRPGQHRGVPEMASTLNVGAGARRWREAVLATAEQAADFTFLMKTQMSPDTVQDAVAPFSTMDITKRMMGFLPAGWDPYQPDAKFPSTTHAEFNKGLINEQARPKSMPYNKAACDSSSYNYASGRLDHQTYYSALDVDREDCSDDVLERVFPIWFDIAVAQFGWLGGNPDAVSFAAREHIWDWPKHRVADVESEANANETKLTSGQMFLSKLYTESGMDLADEITAAATAFGVGEDEIKRRLLDITLPVQQQGGQPAAPAAPGTDAAVAAIFKDLLRRQESLRPKANGNGASHVN
jgi:capsid protein